MDTTRSDRIVQRFRQLSRRPARRVQEHERVLAASAGEVFPLLCPAREADWIPGWDSDIVHSGTGYAALAHVSSFVCRLNQAHNHRWS